MRMNYSGVSLSRWQILALSALMGTLGVVLSLSAASLAGSLPSVICKAGGYPGDGADAVMSLDAVDGIGGKQGPRLLHVGVFLQGLYDPATGQMRQAHDFGPGGPVPVLPGGWADHVRISLHEAGDYEVHDWGELLVFETETMLGCNGQASIDLPEQLGEFSLSGDLWVSVSHRNHLETVFHTPVSFDGPGPFHVDFIEGGAGNNPALGGNQALLGVAPGENGGVYVYGLYAGDIDGDGRINIGDRSLLTTRLSLGIRGYVPEDLNGDGLVTITDRSLLMKNLSLGVRSVKPGEEGSR